MRGSGVAKLAKEFTVSVTRNAACKTSCSYIPKPVPEMLGSPNAQRLPTKEGQSW